MGSAAGIRFHLQATHGCGDDVLNSLLALQRDKFGLQGMRALANIHGALHKAAAARAVIENETGTGPYICTECGERTAVVILTTAKLCRPCAMTVGAKIGRENA